MGVFGVAVVVQSGDVGVGLVAGFRADALVALCLACAERRFVLATKPRVRRLNFSQFTTRTNRPTRRLIPFCRVKGIQSLERVMVHTVIVRAGLRP